MAKKIEIKNRENQRLSMQNEQLQFRLQSHPNLSISTTADLSFTSMNISMNQSDKTVNDDSLNNNDSSEFLKTYESSPISKRHNDKSDNRCTTLPHNSTTISTVKLRSKSFKIPLVSSQSTDSTSTKDYFDCFPYANNNQQFRPVSEAFEYNINTGNERDLYMTRSVIMYNNSSSSSNDSSTKCNNNNIMCNNSDKKYLNTDYGSLMGDLLGGNGSSSADTNDDVMVNSMNDCDSTTSSSSNLDNIIIPTKNENHMTKSVPCMLITADKN